MERKIGEIFEYNDEWYQCVESDSCDECSLFTTECGSGTKSDLAYKVFGLCSKARRSDNKYAICKKLEKVGEPVVRAKRPKSANNFAWFPYAEFQKYKVSFPVILPKEPFTHFDEDKGIVYIEIKQNKEDMEEKKLTYEELEHYYNTTVGLWAIDRSPQEVDLEWITKNAFQLGIDEKLSNLETTGKNLRPFSIEAAKAGKPVCTRDGRKARIICSDAKDITPIIALVLGKNSREEVQYYDRCGRIKEVKESPADLMMLPEKHEGWINVYKDDRPYTESDNIYSSKEAAVEASKAINKKDYVTTVKIEWEE